MPTTLSGRDRSNPCACAIGRSDRAPKMFSAGALGAVLADAGPSPQADTNTVVRTIPVTCRPGLIRPSHTCPTPPGTSLGGGSLAQLDQAFADGVEHGLSPAVDFELLVDIGHVVASRLVGDAQAPRALAMCEALGQQLEDLDFT